MKLLPLVMVLTASFDAGCALAQSRHIHEQADPYTGLRTLFLEVSTGRCSGDPSLGPHDPVVHLLFSASESREGPTAYFLTPELDHGYTLNVPHRGTMDTLIDGVPGGFATADGSTVTTQYAAGGSYPHETIPYAVSKDDLLKLASAEYFQFRVNGPKRMVQRCTDAKHLRDLAEFVQASLAYASSSAAGGPSAPPSPLYADTDPDTNLRTLKLTNIATKACAGDPPIGAGDPAVEVDLTANERKDGNVWYFFTVDITHGPELNLKRGDHIEVTTDKKTSVFNTINGSREYSAPEPGGAMVTHESIAFHLHQANLVAMGRSDGVEFRITGSGATLHRCIAPEEFKQLSQFLGIADTYITAEKK